MSLARSVLLIATVLAAGPWSSAGELPVVRVAYHPNLHGAGVVALGEEKGFFDDAGIRVDARRFTAGPQEIQAIVAGDIDVGFLGTGALPPVMEGKALVVAVDLLGLADEVLARPESGVARAADLAGKRVITTLGTSGEMILRIALDRAGVDRTKVEILTTSPENAVAAFRAGEVDALALWQPLTNQAREDVEGARLIASGQSLYPETVFPIVWVANRDFARNRPLLLRRFLAAARDAIDYRSAHVDETIEIIARRTGVPLEILRAQRDSARFLRSDELDEAFRDGSAARWFTALGDLFVRMGRLERPIPVGTWFSTEHFLAAPSSRASDAPLATRDESPFSLVRILIGLALTGVLTGAVLYWKHRRR